MPLGGSPGRLIRRVGQPPHLDQLGDDGDPAAGAMLDLTSYPIIDVEDGGSISQLADAMNRLIDVVVPAANEILTIAYLCCLAPPAGFDPSTM